LQDGDLKCLVAECFFGKIFPYMKVDEVLKKLPLHRRIGYYCWDYMTPIYEHTYIGSFSSAYNSVVGADRVVESMKNGLKDRIVYCLNVSPGHHATGDKYGGYCFLDNAALAVERLMEYEGVKRVAMLDVDYHHGNGQQEIFYKQNNVLTISIHADPALEYPSFFGFSNEIGEGDGVGYNMNFPLGKGTQWDEYSIVLKTAIFNINDFNCDVLVIPFGGDTYVKDSDPSNKGGFAIDIEDYYKMGKLIHDSLLKKVPILITQEGGYNMEAIGDIIRNFLIGLTGGNLE
jgi:acetoin utilization deacetylase AcuC-like enzyme